MPRALRVIGYFKFNFATLAQYSAKALGARVKPAALLVTFPMKRDVPLTKLKIATLAKRQHLAKNTVKQEQGKAEQGGRN